MFHYQKFIVQHINILNSWNEREINSKNDELQELQEKFQNQNITIAKMKEQIYRQHRSNKMIEQQYSKLKKTKERSVILKNWQELITKQSEFEIGDQW
jgi:hypothetical protein